VKAAFTGGGTAAAVGALPSAALVGAPLCGAARLVSKPMLAAASASSPMPISR
jgi:hypothetical protein